MKEAEWVNNWRNFKYNLPHQQPPYSKKNWGNINHSLCSYQGKLKPAIAHHLVTTFVPKGGRIFDPFSGVGTIPFEAALNGMTAFAMDISIMAYYITLAKIGKSNLVDSLEYIKRLKEYLSKKELSEEYITTNGDFGLNKKLSEYYERNTFLEILKSRLFFQEYAPSNSSEMVVISAMLHVLHGNRPYALSRKSHPITPYAPTGDFEYRSVIEKVSSKVEKFYSQDIPSCFHEGKAFLSDSTDIWNGDINNLDAIITSPPFFDSTRFYSANWIRLWFCGWDKHDFTEQPKNYVDEIQKKDINIYDSIFRQARERLKDDGVFVMHLGKSKKCNMGEVLSQIALRYFGHYELFSEDVTHCNTFGIKDIGTVTDHQYLIMW